MIKRKTMVLIGCGFFLSATLSLTAFFFEDYRLFLFIPSVIILVVSLVATQLAYGYYLYKKNTQAYKDGKVPCPYCAHPVEQHDQICSNCHKDL